MSPAREGAVDVAGGEEAVALEEFPAARSAPGPASLSLQVAETRFHGGGVGDFDLGGDGMPAERPQHRDRLRR
jgi:hypothetical protein